LIGHERVASREFKKESQGAKFYTEKETDESWRLISDSQFSPIRRSKA
jgi:hypothetical protein